MDPVIPEMLPNVVFLKAIKTKKNTYKLYSFFTKNYKGLRII